MEDTKVFCNIARGFTIPGIRYRFNTLGPGGASGIDANSNLEPETTLLYELGAEQKLPAGVEAGLTWYRVIADNTIVVSTVPMPPHWDNSETTIRYYGIETFLGYDYQKKAGARLAYSFINNEYEENGQTKVLSFVPKHKLAMHAHVVVYGLFVGVNGEYVRTVYQDTNKNQQLSNYMHLDMKLAYTFLKRYQAFINFNNITNNEYTTFKRGTGDYTVPGFNVLAGLNASW
jgi:outer membrane receptor protein involved in Fe transport